jgi:protein TonB
MVTSTDRLIFTVIFSVIFHLVIILGVSFEVSSPPTNQPPINLEITLVKQQTNLEPEKADFLAQANNEGGGETDSKSPEPTPNKAVPKSSEATETQPLNQLIAEAEPVIPQPTPPTPKPVVHAQPTPPAPIKTAPTPPTKAKETKKPLKAITTKTAERKITQTEEVLDKEVVKQDKSIVKPKLSARDLIFQARDEIQRLERKLDESTKALSKRPKKRPLSSRTKEYAAAAYHESWRKKVERIGNLNYPQEAKRQRINGDLMLSVDINPDGSVPPDGIVVSRSSGHKVLDDAAVKIVRLAAPFSPIPANVLKDNDMITIIRTWKFETDKGLLSR